MIFHYPYTDLYNLNLDWIIKAIKEVQAVIGDLGSVVNSVNGMTGNVELTSEIINSIIGGVVNSFNGRAGNVTLTPQDVNDTLIDITYTSDPGETISDYSQQDLNLFYSNGVRVMIMVNSQGQPDRLYFLTMVGDDATPQQYTPTGAIAGVSSYNGQTGDVTGVSSFNGQSGAVTGVASFNGQGGAVTGVNSVNGATGTVSLNAQNLPIAEGQTSTIAAALAGKQPVLTFDSSPTAGSSNPVTSGGVAAALYTKQDELTFDTIPTLNSNNPVTSGGVAFELSRKQNTLTFDNTPTADSVNPVTSGGVYSEINKITTTSQDVITSTSGTLTAVKYGNVVTICWNNGTVTTTDTLIATLPEKYKPLINIGCIGMSGNSGRIHFAAEINTAGDVVINKADSQQTYGKFTLTYIGNTL